jgi:hypothetical protein
MRKRKGRGSALISFGNCMVGALVWVVLGAFSAQAFQNMGGANQEQRQKNSEVGTTKDNLPNTPERPADDAVVIRIDGKEYTFGDYVHYWNNFDKREFFKVGNALGTGERLINDYLMAKEARAVDGFMHRPGLQSRIYGRTGGLWRDLYWAKVVRPQVKYTRQDVLDFMPMPTQTVTIRQFLANTREDADKYRGRALAGEDFVSLIQNSSTGLSARTGGVVENVSAVDTRFSTEFLTEMFKTPEGAFSGIVFLPIGYTFFRVEEIRTPEKWQQMLFPDFEAKLQKKLAGEVWAADRARIVGEHAIVVNKETQAKFQERLTAGETMTPILRDVYCTFDGYEILVADVVDPMGQGVIHGGGTADSLLDRFIENIAIREEAKKAGLSDRNLEMIEEMATDSIIAREYVAYRAENIKVEPKEIEKYYEENREKEFSYPAMNRFSVIETRSADRVKSIYELLSSGKPFAEVARDWSDHESKLTGGDIGWGNLENIRPEFAPIKGLAVGEYLKEPISFGKKSDGTPMVFSIFQCTEIKPAGIQPLDEPTVQKIATRLMAWKRKNINEIIRGELAEKYNGKVTFDQDIIRRYSESILPSASGAEGGAAKKSPGETAPSGGGMMGH